MRFARLSDKEETTIDLHLIQFAQSGFYRELTDIPIIKIFMSSGQALRLRYDNVDTRNLDFEALRHELIMMCKKEGNDNDI